MRCFELLMVKNNIFLTILGSSQKIAGRRSEGKNGRIAFVGRLRSRSLCVGPKAEKGTGIILTINSVQIEPKCNPRQDHRRLLLKNIIHSSALTEAQADKELKREKEEFMAQKRKKKEEEKKAEESKKSLLEKHNELMQQEQGG